MKTDRHLAIINHLLLRGTVSASALAARFEVSRRTIQRDMETLTLAGIPIASEFGAEGGYRILDGFAPAKQIAGPADYQTILTALSSLNTALDSRQTRETLEKAMTVMDGGDPRIFVDFSIAREDPQINARLTLLEQAIAEERPLRLVYANAEQKESVQRIEPLALSFQWHAWYLFAFSLDRQDYRLYKLSRMSSCECVGGKSDSVSSPLSSQGFSRDHGDVAELMRNHAEKDRRGIREIRLLCRSDARQAVLEYLRPDRIEDCDGGDFIAALRVPQERMWFSLLLGFGNQVRVLEPPDLQQMLKRKAEEILEMY